MCFVIETLTERKFALGLMWSMGALYSYISFELYGVIVRKMFFQKIDLELFAILTIKVITFFALIFTVYNWSAVQISVFMGGLLVIIPVLLLTVTIQRGD